ncbi:type VI secretion system amidase effector protein Tae4 [Vibrio alginolyticus]|uniref:type VI secretion system amidase effector protein Tae4 n=1 Tax=Vibrio alginolyticus TaxID=663 RepID=UPI00215FC570|nr:type VI secretion system amidase effector protein Tae4 [Vibrio alginolyticus]MCS0178987.1 type VI secretion system amidase effector protein Tae4 [Vibrio alginolyticus]
MKIAFDQVNISVSDVGTLIGGKVNYNINGLTPSQGQFQNACAIRMSYALNSAGYKIPFMRGSTVSGGKGNWYIYKVKALVDFLRNEFGEPDQTIENPTVEKLSKYRGILVVDVESWSDASGHATLWYGSRCSDECYFPLAKKAYLWKLED